MNNHGSDQDYNKNHEYQMSIELDGCVIQFPLLVFNNLLECEINNYVTENEITNENFVYLNDLVNVQCWKRKFYHLEMQYKVFESIVNRLKRDLQKNKFAQPLRCNSASVNQNVYVSMNFKMKAARNEINKKYQVFTISDSEDDAVVITDTSKIKPIQTESENIIDLDNNTQNLEVKYKPASKSKTNVSISDLKTNDNDEVLPINTETGKTLSNGECSSPIIRKRKPGPKSKTMFAGDMVSFNAENEETIEKKKRLNEREVINNEESNTKKLLNCDSVKKLEVLEKYYHKFLCKSSNLEYPPPCPSIPPYKSQPSWKNVPPIPNMTITSSENKVVLTWDLNLTLETAKIKMYELFVCQETDAPPITSMWKKKGNIEADLLPMACELEVFDLGHIYHFALRAVDVHNRRAPFAIQKIKI